MGDPTARHHIKTMISTAAASQVMNSRPLCRIGPSARTAPTMPPLMAARVRWECYRLDERGIECQPDEGALRAATLCWP
ncbi:hypothetical protein GCM10009645_42820 [Mycolicibacterium poriferae]|uniref:Uncharacterized protein n=2 Tax=Mycolicibacterium poriferae TaxID=39694 RepID=A0A6N4V5L4_9MYCO|nr:hypothetical protein MPOR_19780 [Mycolicibacterium poriferae]